MSRHHLVIATALLVVCVPRAVQSFSRTVPSAHDREWEHFGPTWALGPLKGSTVLVNDIGVISYYGVVHAIDAFGLADNEALRLKRARQFDALGALAFARRNGARFAEFQICWAPIYERLPESWLLVEAWTGPRNVLFGDLTIGFFAQPGAPVEELRGVLARQQPPAGVHRFGLNDPLVRAYNADPSRVHASLRLCRTAPLRVIGKPVSVSAE